MADIERLFKNALQDIEIPPKNDLWDKIQKTYKRRRFIRKTVLYSSIMFFVLLFTAYFLMQKSDVRINSKKIFFTESSVQIIDRYLIIAQDTIRKQSPDTIFFDKTINKNFEGHIYLTDADVDTTELINLPQKPTEDTPEITNPKLTEVNNSIEIKVEPLQGCSPLKVNIRLNLLPTYVYVDNKFYNPQKEFDIIFDEPGRHVIKVFSKFKSDSVIIDVYPKADADFMIPIKTIVKEPISFKNKSKNATLYKWNFGDGAVSDEKNPVHIYSNEGLYYVQLIAMNDYCRDSIVKVVQISKKEQYLLFPNAIIPNTGGPTGGYYNGHSQRNDIFYPVVVKKPVAEYHLRIYSRDGNLVFRSNNIQIGWDGYYKGQMVSTGVYVYIVEGRFKDGTALLQKGDLMVLNPQR